MLTVTVGTENWNAWRYTLTLSYISMLTREVVLLNTNDISEFIIYY
jgi:hypothetical protein